MDYGEFLNFGWGFARNRERINLLLVFFLAALVAGGVILLCLLSLTGSVPIGGGGLRALMGTGFWVLAVLLFAVFAVVLVGFWLWLNSGFIANAAAEYSRKNVKLRESLDYAKTRFWTVVVAVVLIGIVSFVVQLPFALLQLLPFIGILFLLLGVLVRFLLQLSFFFAQYEVVAAGEGAVASLRKSFALFSSKPLEVFIVFIIAIVAAILLFIVSLIPAAVLFVIALAVNAALKSFAGTVIAVLIGVLGLLALLVFVAFTELFSTGFLTAAFLELAGGRGALGARGAPAFAGAVARSKAPVLKRRAVAKPVKPVRRGRR